jgi:hypothetical protein
MVEWLGINPPRQLHADAQPRAAEGFFIQNRTAQLLPAKLHVFNVFQTILSFLRVLVLQNGLLGTLFRHC